MAGQYFFKTIDDNFLPLSGGTVSGNTYINANLSADTLNLVNTPNNDDSLTEILARNSTTGDVEYRDVQSIISAATSQDTFVTGGTFNDISNELTLKRNDSVDIIISGFSSGAQFGTTYFVAPEGNDSTGEYGNISKPFKTITGARNQLLVDSLSGQTLIYVFPGTYDETELQYPNGKMYLSPGSLIKPSAKIEGAGAAMTAVNQGTKTFTFNGNWSTNLIIGKRFKVVGGANDGTYTIVSATDVGGTTEVVVSETIPSASVGGKLRNNETVFILGSTPLNAPSGSTSNKFDLYGEGDIDIVKSLDDDWSGGIVTAFGSAEFYGEAVTWRQEKGVLMGGYEDSKMTFNGSTLELYGNSGYVTTARDSSDTTFNFDRIISNGSYTFFIRYGSSPTFNGSCVVTSNVIKAIGSSQAIGLQRMGPGGRVVINSPIVESNSFTLNAAQNSGGELILNGNIVASTPSGSGVVAGLDFGTEAKFTINGNITTDSGRAFWGVGNVNSSWYLNGNIESLSGSTDPILDLGAGSGSVNLNGSVKNTDGGTTLDGISTGGVSIVVENLEVTADNETITSSSPQTVEILHSLSINNPLGSNITTTGLFNYTGTTNVGDLVIYNTPTNDDSLTQILGRNSTTGNVEYRDVSSIIPEGKLQNTYFVSSLSGDNSTALVGDINKPFKTITGARNQAVADGFSNSLIYVHAGDYIDYEVQYENGNFYFEPNANVTLSGSTSIFRLGTNLNIADPIYTGNTCNVYGYGNFIVPTSVPGGGINTMGLNSGLSPQSYFECNSIDIDNGVGFFLANDSKITLKCDLIKRNVGPGTTGCIRISDDSEGYINVRKIEGGTGAPAVECRWTFGSTFNGKALINIDKIETTPGCLPVFIVNAVDGSEVVLNSNKLTHTSSGSSSDYLLYNQRQRGGTIRVNANLENEASGILYGGLGSDAGLFEFNGNIRTKYTAINHTLTDTSTDIEIKYNGDIVVDGDATSAIVMNGSTLSLNGSLKDLNTTGTTNGVTINGTTDLKIVNFDIDVNTESIVSSAPNEVEIIHSLNINKPLNSNITTTGLYNFTGTTNLGDLSIYNTPTNDNSLTQILGRNSTTGDVEYRDVQSIISAATSQDTFVTGFTYDGSNKFIISDNSGSTFSTIINTVTGLTSNGNVEVVGNLIVTGGTGNVLTKQVYVENNLGLDWDFPSSSVVLGNNSDGTIINGTSLTINSDALVNGNVTGNSLTLPSITNDDSLTEILARNSSGLVEYRDVASIVGAASADTYVVSGNADVATSQLTFTYNTGGTFTVTNSAALFADNDINVTGGTYNPTTGCVTFSTNSGTTFDVCGFVTGITDTYVTGGTYNSSTDTIDLTRTDLGTVSITGVTDTFYWTTGSTGNYSIRALNDTAVDATGDYAVAEGSSTIASGQYSHAEGAATIAGGNYSHAEGSGTIASGQYSHVQGFQSQATGDTSHAEGYRTVAGDFSHAEGWETKALSYSHAEGLQTTASGDVSHAEGYLTTASGVVSHAEGEATTASGQNSHAEGSNTVASGQTSHAEGSSTTALGLSSHSEGSGTVASGAFSHAEGYGAKGALIASGEAAHAEGISTTASGEASHAEGDLSEAAGNASHAEGSGTLASGFASHAEGEDTIASGDYSHAGGNNSSASGFTSFVHSTNSIVTGDRSVVLGGQNLTGATNDTVYVPYLNINNLATGTSINNLGIDVNGNVVTGITSLGDITRVQPGVNINTGGTENNPVVNLDDDISLNSVSANTLSGATIYSGSTDLYDIFLTNADGNDITRVQNGINTFTGGTENNPTINVTALTIDNITVSGDSSFDSVSATTIYSGSTDLSDIFATKAEDSFSTGGTVTQQATSASTEVVIQIDGNNDFSSYNITGLTDTFVSGFTYSANTFTISQNDGNSFDAEVDTIDLSSVLSAVTFDIGTTGSISATTFYSGSTDLSDIFLTEADGNDITRVQPGTNINTGGTANNPIVNLDDDILLNSVSGNTLSGGTLYSGSTDLSDIFLTTADGNDITRVQSGINTFTGGTGNNPTVNVTGLTIDNISVSGVSVFQSVSATTYFGDGSNLSGISSEDNFVTGGTFSATTLTLDRQNGSVTITGFTSGDANTFVTGFTYNDANTFTISDNAGSSFSASINTVTGLTTTSYIDFDTQSNPSNLSGRTFFDSQENALSYYPETLANDVTINIGQESVIKVYNGTGLQINNGQACHIDGSSPNGIPSVILAIATGNTSTGAEYEVSGVATHDIPNGTEGFITAFGLVRDLNITGITEGNEIYLSDTTPGELLYSKPTNTASRLSQIGWVVKTGATDAKILVEIVNEVGYSDLSNSLINVIAENNSSTGTRNGGEMTINSGDNTLFDVSAGSGIIVDNYTDPNSPTITNVVWGDITGNTVINLTGATASFIFLDSNLNTVQFANTNPPTEADYRDNIYLGILGHANFTSIINAFNAPTSIVSPINQLQDLTSSIGPFSIGGNRIQNITGTLKLLKTEGRSYFYGGNFHTDNKIPSSITTAQLSGSTLVYATGANVLGPTSSDIDPNNYDPDGLGVITAIPGVNSYVAHRIWHNPQQNLVAFQYGQEYYPNSATARDEFEFENFVVPAGLNDVSYLVAVVIAQDGDTDLDSATIIPQGKFAGTGGGGGSVADTLQTAYDNSSSPEILTDSTREAVDFRVGSGSDSDNLVTFQQNSGTINAFVEGTGDAKFTNLTGTSITSNSAINVFNGHVNLRDNSYFLQGRTVADVNVSLIGVDNQDRVFVGNAGYDTYINSDTIVDGVLSAQTAFLTTTPTLNNSATDILVRNSSTGEVEYRPVSGITPDTNTFVTGGTYNDTTDIITLNRNDGVTIDITGVTDTFTTGATYDNGTATATFNRNDGNSYTLDLSTIDVNDTFITGFTYNDANTFTISRNDGVDMSTSFNVVSGLTVNDILSATTLDANTILSGGTNLYDIFLTTNDGNDITRVQPGTNINTGGTANNPVVNLDDDISLNSVSGSTLSGGTIYSGSTDLYNIFATASSSGEANTASNLGAGEGLFAQKNGVDLQFKSLTSTGTSLSISSDVSTVNLERNNLVSVTSITGSSYSAITSDEIIGLDTTSLSPTLFLPDSTAAGKVRFEIKDTGVNARTNPITVQAVGSDTIITTSVVSSTQIFVDGGSIILVSTGSGQWWQM